MSLQNERPDMLDVMPSQDRALVIPDWLVPKSQWETRAIRIAENLTEGGDVVTALIYVKQLAEMLAVAEEKLKDRVMMKVNKPIEYAGVKVEVRNKAPKYDFGNNTRRNQMVAEIDLRKGELKTYEKWLASIKEPTPDPNTGEIVSPAKVVELGCTIAVTFPKGGSHE